MTASKRLNRMAAITLSFALAAASLLAYSPSAAQAATINQTLTINNTATGKTPKYMGDNLNNAGGLNLTPSKEEWLKNSGINAGRLWMTMNEYEPSNDDTPYGNGVNTLAKFNTAKNAVLANPASNSYINWTAFNNRFASSDLDSGVAFYVDNDITPIVTLKNNVSWLPNDMTGWDDKWEWWEYCFAIAYHLYSNFGIIDYEIGNEPNINGYTAAAVLKQIQYGSDAVTSAVHAVEPTANINIMGPTTATTNPASIDFTEDVLNAQGSGIDTKYGDEYLTHVSFHMYRPAESTDSAYPGVHVPVGIVQAMEDIIANNDHDSSLEDLFITEENQTTTPDPNDPHVNAMFTKQLIEVINHAQNNDSSHSWLKGILKFRFAATSGSVDDGTEYTNPHQYFYTYNMLIKGLQRIKDIMSITTSLDPDEVLVSRDPTYYYILFTNLSSTDTQQITLNTSNIGISSAPAYITTSSATNPGARSVGSISGSSMVYNVAPDTVSLVRIPRNAVKTLSTISLTPSSSVNLDVNGAQEFLATAHYSDGSTKDISDLVTWSSSNSSHVQILTTGLALGVASGTSANITCSFDGKTSNAITVHVN